MHINTTHAIECATLCKRLFYAPYLTDYRTRCVLVQGSVINYVTLNKSAKRMAHRLNLALVKKNYAAEPGFKLKSSNFNVVHFPL